MNLEEIRAKNWERTGRASDVARQLSFAGIAGIWAMREPGTLLSYSLRLAAALFILALALDFIQYAWSATFWSFWHRRKEKEGAAGELLFPRWFNWPADWCFYPKLAAVLIGYAVLLSRVTATLL